MSSTLKLIGISILVVIINVSISRMGYINLIWIMTVVFLLTENENFSISYAVLGGCLYDVLMHNNVGETSLVVLIGIVVFLLFRSLISGDNLVFKVVAVILLLVVTFASKAFLSVLIDGSTYSSISDFLYWWKDVITHSIFIWVLVIIFGGMRGIISSEKKIKIR